MNTAQASCGKPYYEVEPSPPFFPKNPLILLLNSLPLPFVGVFPELPLPGVDLALVGVPLTVALSSTTQERTTRLDWRD